MLAVGTRGDVQPLTVLGGGLKAAGFNVRIATHASLENLVTSSGLEFSLVSPDPRDLLRRHSDEPGRDNYDGVIAFGRGIRSSASQVMKERVTGCWEASRDADLVIATPLAVLSGYHIAEKRQIPLIRISYVPASPTRSLPSPFLHPSIRLGGQLNLLSHRLGDRLVWTFLRSHANAARRDVLDLPPLSRRSPLKKLDEDHQAVLNVYSPSFWPPPADWGSWIHVSGFLFTDHADDWQPAPALAHFLEDGPPPVYVGFGSMPSRSPKEMATLVVNAVKQAGQRALLGRGWGGIDGVVESEDIFFIDEVPHDWLFPRLASVVHHGGLSVTGVALRAGVPMGTVPFLPDGRAIGHRVAELGLGPPPLSRRQLTSERLAEVIRSTATDQGMKRRATAMSKLIRQEDGLSRAVEVVEAVLRGTG